MVQSKAVATDAPPAGPDTQRRMARLVTEVLAPTPLAVVLLTAVAWRSAPTAATALLSGSVAVLFASVVPMWFVLRGVRRGSWENHHIPAREHRQLPLLVGLGSVLAGLTLLAIGGAPRELLALIASMVAGLVVSLLVTTVWKMSIHAAVSAGTVVILALVFGPAGLLAAPLAVAVAWSRVALRDHTVPQVLVGLVVGALVAGTSFSLLR